MDNMDDMGLQVRFTFSDALMEANNIKREDVYHTLKKHFEQRGLVCISEGEILAFKDTGDEDDYGNMWAILIGFIRSDWFLKCAASCDFIEDGEVEDVFIQIPELKKMFASGTRKQITFDLSDNNLKKYYPRPKIFINPQYYKKAWEDIAKFMKKNGFEHRQYFVYVSKEPLTKAKVNILVNEMAVQMPWLNKCLNAIEVTNVGKQHSLMKAVEDAASQLEKPWRKQKKQRHRIKRIRE